MYNYYEAMKEDIKEYLEENEIEVTEENVEELEEQLNDDLWCDDSVTGNGSGSYTFNRSEAEEYVKENITLCIDAVREFGIETRDFGKKVLSDEWEYLDVTIRCYILGSVIREVLSEELNK